LFCQIQSFDKIDFLSYNYSGDILDQVYRDNPIQLVAQASSTGLVVVSEKRQTAQRMTDLFSNIQHQLLIEKAVPAIELTVSDVNAISEMVRILKLYPELKKVVTIKSSVPTVIREFKDISRRQKLGLIIRKQLAVR